MTHRLVDPTELMDRASRTSGLDDFGSDSFLEGLTILCRGLNQPRVTDQGRAILRGEILRHLSSRLAVVDRHHQHPEIA